MTVSDHRRIYVCDITGRSKSTSLMGQLGSTWRVPFVIHSSPTCNQMCRSTAYECVHVYERYCGHFLSSREEVQHVTTCGNQQKAKQHYAFVINHIVVTLCARKVGVSSKSLLCLHHIKGKKNCKKYKFSVRVELIMFFTLVSQIFSYFCQIFFLFTTLHRGGKILRCFYIWTKSQAE